ncbi:serine/threonine-protein kinase ATG1c-like [Diospyros lotus]|uniref:serine/threonine-protein kinase ATG1c-like n=1 Tax=Diospyros lotus TaxID=55363 RepID=UPI0022560729|nr:serine/threonine-protein kinase ATG1c-like [Diospyros lotus]XP_052172957.1 serine/threonine-protein kinase ATG1c-like [Diospyros lotus]
MAQSSSRGARCVGDYVVGRQIGSGSFSVVWHARHKVHGAEVAIKEIVMGRLNKKLQESLLSEIDILKQINHPNIIRLHDIIQETGRIHLVLEYCRGGDLSMYMQQRQGRVPEGTAKYFMRQLVAGLQVLHHNNYIHRDLKPQNLLLSTNSDNAVLKIADFGFARSLQPRGLAETLCGSPLYMAPEIMRLQKYDAKADLWSVGAILFQLVTGKTPFTGGNQIQLLQNIEKSTDLQFPGDKNDLSSDCIDLCRKLLRRNPVERLHFVDFFNHPFLSLGQPNEMLRGGRSPSIVDDFPFFECNPVGKEEESSREDCLPFCLDDDSSGPDGSPSLGGTKPMKSTYGFSLDRNVDRKEVSNTNIDLTSKYSNVTQKLEKPGLLGNPIPSAGNLKESFRSTDQRPPNTSSKVVDSLELIDQDYVFVSGPPVDVSSSSASASKLSPLPCKLESPQQESANINSMSTAPMPIIGATGRRVGYIGSLDSHSSAPSGTSQGSMDMRDTLEQPSTNCMTRIKSLQRCASAIKELVNEKIEAGRQLEAFSIQLVILAIWKQALHICHTQAVSAVEGFRLRESTNLEHGSPDIASIRGTRDICSQIERDFLLEIGNAEELAKVIEPGNVEMPDAIEMVYKSALDFGKRGGLDEYMGGTESAAVFYSKAVRLLDFLLVEASSLILNPPFSLTNSDRYRLRNYIDMLNNRQSQSRSQRMAILKCEDQRSPP